MSAKVFILTLLSVMHFKQGRDAISINVVPKGKANNVKKNRKSEEQAYVEHQTVVGGCSQVIELPLKRKRCEIQVEVSGALKLSGQGNDVIEYNDSLGECRKIVTLLPTNDTVADGIATIAYKVEGKKQHEATIHGVQSTDDFSRYASRSYVGEPEAEVRQRAMNVGSDMAGDEQDPKKIPNQTEPPAQSFDEMTLENPGRQGKADTIETAYDAILSDKSLNTLSRALPPTDAYRLLIYLGVPDSTIQQSHRMHHADVVTGNYESFKKWRNRRKTKRQQEEASNQQLYGDLLNALAEIGRRDLKGVMERALESNKELEMRDFENH